MKKCLLAAIIFSLLMIPVFSAYNSWGIPDSSEIRAKLVENWFENDLENIRNNLQEIYINSAGQKFQVRLEESESTYNIFVSPAAEINVKIISDKETRTQKTEVFPGDNPGSWVLIKDKKTNKPIRIRYYFKPNSEVYIQFSPHNRTAFADMVIFDNYVSRSIPCGVPFELFYKASFEDVLNVTKSILPWNYVTTNKSDYHSILQMSAVIKENLPAIMYAPDAMYDENDKVVRITNGKPFEAVVAENQKQNSLKRSRRQHRRQQRRRCMPTVSRARTASEASLRNTARPRLRSSRQMPRSILRSHPASSKKAGR